MKRLIHVLNALLILVAGGPCPAQPAATAQGRVIITEIMYNPASTEGRGEAEWVEIANVGDAAVTLDGWRLDDEDRDDWGTFDATLQPGEVAVLYNKDAIDDPGVFYAAWGRSVAADGDANSTQLSEYQAIGVRWSSLGNAADENNEVLTLQDADGQVVCSVNYQTKGDWPDVSKPDGRSIWLSELTGDLNDGKLWKASEESSSGGRLVHSGGVFNGADVGSPGFVPGLSRVAGDNTENAKQKKKARKGDDEIDY